MDLATNSDAGRTYRLVECPYRTELVFSRDGDVLVSVRTAARLLGVGYSTLKHRLADGRGPLSPVRHPLSNRCQGVRLADLERWAEERGEEPGARLGFTLADLEAALHTHGVNATDREELRRGLAQCGVDANSLESIRSFAKGSAHA